MIDKNSPLFYTVGDLASLIRMEGASYVWEELHKDWPVAYNMLLLASLEMQAKELENLKGGG